MAVATFIPRSAPFACTDAMNKNRGVMTSSGGIAPRERFLPFDDGKFRGLAMMGLKLRAARR